MCALNSFEGGGVGGDRGGGTEEGRCDENSLFAARVDGDLGVVRWRCVVGDCYTLLTVFIFLPMNVLFCNRNAENFFQDPEPPPQSLVSLSL